MLEQGAKRVSCVMQYVRVLLVTSYYIIPRLSAAIQQVFSDVASFSAPGRHIARSLLHLNLINLGNPALRILDHILAQPRFTVGIIVQLDGFLQPFLRSLEVLFY